MAAKEVEAMQTDQLRNPAAPLSLNEGRVARLALFALCFLAGSQGVAWAAGGDTQTEAVAREQIRQAVMSIGEDIESGDIEGLQRAHLGSSKFTKFGPRTFERQDVASTNRSEAEFFSSISNPTYRVRDLKIDIFGDVGVATYYPDVSFTREGERINVTGRQTLVFLRTEGGWKIVHEHGTVRQ